MLRVKNFLPAISLEGFELATDGRRGEGVYQKVVRAMDLLREKRLPFGISACYTSQNLDSISSPEFIDQLTAWGAKFIWYFHYMPVGNDAAPELECLQGPIFMAYHDGQPFNDNHLMPCPMLENPELLKKMVHDTGAHSTDLESPETVEHLCDKCASYAACWKPEAERLWRGGRSA